MQKSMLTADVYPRRGEPGTWVVEAIDVESEGEVYLARFDGPDARARAIEYAHAKYARVVIVDRVPSDRPGPQAR